MRAKLAGFFKAFPIYLLIISSGICLIVICQQNVTPASVSVSGYTRSNGVKVSSYSRRTLGAVSHDAPYTFVGFLGFLVFCAGSTGCIYVIYRYKKVNDFDLLPSIEVELPAIPRQQITVPNKNVRARDAWKCLRCGDKINSGDYYWLYEIKYKGRYRYCADCKYILEREYQEIELEIVEYNVKIKELNRIVKTRYYESYKQYYKVTPEEFGADSELHLYKKTILSS